MIDMRNIRPIIFIGVTIMVIGVLTALIIPVASFTTGGIATIISTTLFVIYLIVVDHFFDSKIWLDNKKDSDNSDN